MRIMAEDLNRNWQYAHPILKLSYRIESIINRGFLFMKDFIHTIVNIVRNRQTLKGDF